VILFDDVVKVGTISNLDGIVPTVIEFVIHARWDYRHSKKIRPCVQKTEQLSAGRYESSECARLEGEQRNGYDGVQSCLLDWKIKKMNV
jgi:hypothetical protein